MRVIIIDRRTRTSRNHLPKTVVPAVALFQLRSGALWAVHRRAQWVVSAVPSPWMCGRTELLGEVLARYNKLLYILPLPLTDICTS